MFQQPVFPEAEFQDRYERTWQRMEDAGLDAIVAYSAGNQFWLSGYLGSLSAKRFPEFSHDVLFPKVVRQFTGHNLGHEMAEKPWFGVSAPPDLLLEPGMVIAPEWFIETAYGPILFEESFLVGESGLERLTDFPSKLQVIAD